MDRKLLAIVMAAAFFGNAAQAETPAYADFPITVKDYKGDKESSVSYNGQTARHLLHNSLKTLSKQGKGDANPELKAQMLSYYSGKDAGRAILSPKASEGFPLKQSKIDEISAKKNLAGKAYKGAVTGWPGNMTAQELLAFMIDKASATEGGYDPVNGYDYTQLISKTAMGAVFYNQAVDNYLDEKLASGTKPNDKPYKKGAAYTGKEHVWDEAFGYFGAPAHVMSLEAKSAYYIAKAKPKAFKQADANGDGVVDLVSEMIYAHAYYAADADKSGNTNYLKTITQAFIDGRRLITEANGEKLTDDQRKQLREHAAIIKIKWEQVLAEAAYKYAGSVYEDLKKVNDVVDNGGDIVKVMKAYAKHWGELKGFALSLQMGGKDLGATAVKLNRLIGYSPSLLGDTQVSSLTAEGKYVQIKGVSQSDYMANMIKVQSLLERAVRAEGQTQSDW